MLPPILEHAQLKLLNGKAHTDRFKDNANRFVSGLRPELFATRCARGIPGVGVRVPDTPIPANLPLSMGDAIHNLRAPLDYAISEICHAANPSKQRSNRVSFPFHKTERDLRACVKELTAKEGLPDDIGQIIINDIRPWYSSDNETSGNQALWMLNKLDTDDKHKLLIPVVNITKVIGISGKITSAQSNINIDKMDAEIYQGSLILIGCSDKDAQIHIDGFDAVEGYLLFSGLYFTLQPVLPILEHLADLVGGVLHAFQSHLQGGDLGDGAT